MTAGSSFFWSLIQQTVPAEFGVKGCYSLKKKGGLAYQFWTGDGQTPLCTDFEFQDGTGTVVSLILTPGST